MKTTLRLSALVSLLLVGLAGPAGAQYMKITTDNATDPTRMKLNGTTILTITLDTIHDRNGSPQSCNSHTSLNTYVLADPANLCGTGDWLDTDGASPPATPNTQPAITAPATASGAEGSTFSISATATDPDAGEILCISVTGQPPGVPFSTVCGPSPLTATLTGTPGFNDAGTYVVRWVVTDRGGLSSSATTSLFIANTDRPPVLNPIANMIVAVGGCSGSTADQTISATDPDGDAITFTASLPPFAILTSSQAGNTRTGNIHVAPPSGTVPGDYPASVTATAGGLSDTKSFRITVAANQALVLNQPADVTVTEGTTADQTLTGSDPCGLPLTFEKVSGPTFVTVTTTSVTTGVVHVAPGFADAGTYTVTIRACNGNAVCDTKSFTLTVNNVCRPPLLSQPANMTVNQNATADQVVTGSSPDGSPLTFNSTGPPYMTLTRTSATTANIHLAPGSLDSGTAAASVSVTDGICGTDTKSFTITVITSNNHPPVLNPIANMTVHEAATADQAISASDPDGDALTFSKVAGPTYMTVTTTSATTGNIHLATGFTDAGTAGATVSASDGTLSDSKAFIITVGGPDRPPVLDPIANMSVAEGMTADQTITASDPDGDPLTFSKLSGPVFMTVSTVNPGPPTASGNIHLAPGLADAGTSTAAVRATSPTGMSDTKSFTISVKTSGNRCPTANPGGPYSGISGVPITFDGSASSDPDGNPLTYAWDFDASDGIGVDAVGVTASHAYPAAGTFTITLAVTDNGDGDPAQVCTASASTTATIRAACDATVFNGYDTIRLGSGKPNWFAFVQPATGCYANTDVVTSSFLLGYAGRQVPAEATKTTAGGDKNRDGIQEIRVSWTKDNLRALFSGTGLATGHNLVTVTLEANLLTGGKLRGTTQLDVVNNGNFTISAVAPNPLNPEATLTYTTSRVGFVRIDMFDIQGRLVRRLVDAPAMAAGMHEAKIDGRGDRGERLPSGVYYIRGRSPQGEFKHLVTILK